MQLGAVDYLVFPFDEQEILESIHRTIISLNQVSSLKTKTKDRVSANNDMVYSMVDYIHSHFSEQITLDDLANYMHLNKHYVSTLFKKETGMTYNQYLASYRVEQAKLLLRQTDDLLEDISHQVSYVDPAYFSRTFKKNTDMTPIIYRKTFKGNLSPI